MKFVHTADLHVGANRSLPNYLGRQEEMLDSIFDVAYDHNIDVVVVAGDVFDDPDTTTQAERELVKRKLLEYDSAGFTILVIPGNHDLVDATGYTSLHYLSLLHRHGKFNSSCVTETTSYVRIRDTVFCLLCHRKHHFKEDLAKAVRDFREASLEVSHSHFVVVAHETIRGSMTDVKMSDGSYFRLDKGEDPPDVSLPVTYWALGDIHKPQQVAKAAYYSGSPLQTKFSDSWPRGCLVVDTDDPDNPKFVALSSNRLIKAGKDDIIPPNSYVAWTVKSKDEIPADLPSNVVKVVSSSSDVSLSLSLEGDLRNKLLDGVRQQGATIEELSLASAEIESLVALASLQEDQADV